MSTETPIDPTKPVCYCAFCDDFILERDLKPAELGGEPIAQHPVYKLGKLKSIELAHTRCAPEGWDQELRPECGFDGEDEPGWEGEEDAAVDGWVDGLRDDWEAA